MNAGPDASGDGRGDFLFAAVAGQLAVALLLGGTARDLNVLVVFLAALPTLYLLLAGVRSQPLGWFAVIAITLYALAWLQLLPLPPALWTGLAGRDLAAQVLEVAGLEIGWRPLALDPGAAAAALLALVPPLVMLVAFARLDRSEQVVLLRVVVAFALSMAVLGLVQRVTGGLAPYGTEHAGYATGLFANRNHLAAFLSCALLMLPGLAAQEAQGRGRMLAAAAAAVLLAGILATTSRAGMALGGGAFIVALALALRPRPASVAAGVVVLLAAFAALSMVPVLEPVFARFAAIGDDQRLVMAETSLAAARAFFPFGSGWGSFVPVYMAAMVK